MSNRQIISKSSLKKEEVYLDKNFGSMPLGKKVEYLWMYYKIWLVILAVIIGVIYLGCTMYKGRHTTVLLNLSLIHI